MDVHEQMLVAGKRAVLVATEHHVGLKYSLWDPLGILSASLESDRLGHAHCMLRGHKNDQTRVKYALPGANLRLEWLSSLLML